MFTFIMWLTNILVINEMHWSQRRSRVIINSVSLQAQSTHQQTATPLNRYCKDIVIVTC